ncbi:MAG: hypothetical protein R3Y21_02065 [Mycoplasmatota bacterium]
MVLLMFILIAFIILYILFYQQSSGKQAYKYIVTQADLLYERYAPFSYKEIRKKVKDLGHDFTPREYMIQVAIFAVGAFLISYMYFYSIIISLIYMSASVMVVPYLSYLRCKRIYSEFLFEQVQVYTTNTIMEFATTQSFVKALEGVYESGVLEDPMKSDIKSMIDLAYANGTINESIEYMNARYDYFIVRNMHQLFYQITSEGSKDSGDSLENMSLDIDMLIENVYRDRIDRAIFHKKFIQFGIILYLMVMLIQFLLSVDTYIIMLNRIEVQCLLHGIVLVNSYFLLSGEKYYNENVGAE